MIRGPELKRTLFLAPALIAICAALLGGCGSDGLAPATDSAPPVPAPSAHPRLFSPTSFWNTAPPTRARLDPTSARTMAALGREVAAEQADASGPWISTHSYSVPIYTVGPGQPTVPVKLSAPVFSPALQSAFEAVPLPPRATPSEGTDAHLVVYQPSSDRLWEFWRFARGPEGPRAAWGGAIENVSGDSGAYGPGSWPAAEPWWGASASSLSIAGGLIGLDDLRAGEIDHALALALPEIRAGVYAAPAKRSDGKSQNPLALPEGAHLRLDPKLDLSALHLPRVTRLIAEAAQRYGLFVRDGSTVVQLFAEDPRSTGAKDPYSGPGGYFEGEYPNQLLASFPWEHLQLLKMELHPDG